MAAKNNDADTATIAKAGMDRTTFDWIGKGALNPATLLKVPPCGACHPGSGSTEYIRGADGTAAVDGEGNYVRLDTDYAELVDLGLVSESMFDGDLFPMMAASSTNENNTGELPMNPFEVTGVIEGDCLLCHMPSYNFGARFKQISYRNYQWAAVAGANLGSISGKIFDYTSEAYNNSKDWASGEWHWDADPTVSYASGIDNGNIVIKGEGELWLKGDIFVSSPNSAACLRCHSGADSKKRGFSWAAGKDVHFDQGMDCIDCHGLAGETDSERMAHNIGKGYARLGSVRNDLDGTNAFDCDDCHGEYILDQHSDIFGGPMHLDNIACQTCHIPYKVDNMGYLIDMSSGNQVWMLRDGTTPRWAGDFGAIKEGFVWSPFIKKYDPDGAGPMPEKYYPYGAKASTWFGYVPAGKNTIQPYILRNVKAVYDGLKSEMNAPTVPVELVVDGAGAKPNVSDTEDIVAMLNGLAAHAQTPAGGVPVFVSNEAAYKLDGDTLVAAPYENAETDHNFSIFHNIRPAAEALGANGCTDCHSPEGALVNTQITDVSGFLSTRDIETNGVLDEAAIEANGETMLEFAGFSEEDQAIMLDKEQLEVVGETGSTSECFIEALM